MEYEISDEGRLFDESTNPSQQHDTRRPRVSGRDDPAARRKEQKGEHIPEEEEQLA